MQEPHIGPEHAYALMAIHDRARRVIAEGRFVEPAHSPRPSVATAAPASVRVGPQPDLLDLAAVTELDEDWDFLDGRWTSDGW